MKSVPAPALRRLAAAGPALALLPLLAIARDPRPSAPPSPGPPSPSVEASLDGAHYEALPIKRWRRDAASGRMQWVAVPQAEYRSMRWIFAVPRPLAEAPAPDGNDATQTPPP